MSLLSRQPSVDFLLNLFRGVREEGHVNFMSELIQLASQVSSGRMFSGSKNQITMLMNLMSTFIDRW